MKEQKRLTLTGNKMPEDVYDKLEQLGATRRLTPYIVSLVEKEVMMDKLIDHLTILISKVDSVEKQMTDLKAQIKHSSSLTIQPNTKVPIEPEIIPKGELKVSKTIVGGIEEEIDEIDF
ncbi:hypothetical protein [Bacillus sp. 1P06AnD]|uniref:hypothetical protein n=1 Tax=Bacillus sp. 1P06AnD TaxID=3132208 RepID=UPI0039A25806